jgi:hypothetical protein
MEPWNCDEPNEKMPPSEPTSQYPWVAGGGGTGGGEEGGGGGGGDAGGGVGTVNVKDCVASGATPFDASRHTVYAPASPACGVPSSVAVSPPVYTSERLAGSVDGVQPLNAVSVRELTGGVADVVTSNVSAVPTSKVAASPLVIDGATPVPLPV